MKYTVEYCLPDTPQSTKAMISGQLLSTFSLEILELILEHCSVPSLFSLASASSEHMLLVHSHFKRRSRNMVRPFVQSPESLFSVLKWTRSVISGSSALQYYLPTLTWTARDLDLYTPSENAEFLAAYFKAEGYSQVFRWRDEGLNQVYSDMEGIGDVITLKRGAYMVDIVESLTSSAMSCIFRFHSTAVMNFISAQGFFSAYPTLTASYCSFANPNAYGTGVGGPCMKIQMAYAKYVDRGFRLIYPIERQPALWTGHTICQRSWNCPHTVRTTSDDGCLFITFENNVSRTGCADNSATSRLYKPWEGVIWNIGGGPSCNGKFSTFRPFVLLRGEYCPFSRYYLADINSLQAQVVLQNKLRSDLWVGSNALGMDVL